MQLLKTIFGRVKNIVCDTSHNDEDTSVAITEVIAKRKTMPNLIEDKSDAEMYLPTTLYSPFVWTVYLCSGCLYSNRDVILCKSLPLFYLALASVRYHTKL